MRQAKYAMTLIGALMLGGVLGGVLAEPVMAQVSPFPNTNTGSGQLIQQGVAGSRGGNSTRFEQRQNDQARYSVQQQSCANAGASADRCNSDLRTTIESDKLRNQAIESGRARER